VLALIFPGQGSQRPGMGAPWQGHPSWTVVDELSQATGRDISHLLVEADAEVLRATRNAQLATFAVSLVALDAARRGPLAALAPGSLAAAGHSLGEYSALVAAGALEASAGARLVQARGEAMQAAADANPGTMIAVLGLGGPEVEEACRETDEAWVANDNTPAQVVVAGTHRGTDEAGAAAVRRGAKRVIGLQVGGAFHSPLMRPAQAPLDAALTGTVLSPSLYPVVANVDARPHTGGFGALLSAQLCSQVRWRESLGALAALGASLLVELGPGTELSGMVRRTVPDVARANVAGPDDLDTLAAAIDALVRPA
jgi:[acyl-carrier-protein] S-malonyltransferase